MTDISYKNDSQYVNMSECEIFTCPTAKPLFCSEECFACGLACQFAKYLKTYNIQEGQRYDKQ